MNYSHAFRKNGDASIRTIAPLLSVACLEDKWNGWGLEANIKELLLDKGYSREDAAHDSRILFLQVRNGTLSTTETRGQYTFVDGRQVNPM